MGHEIQQRVAVVGIGQMGRGMAICLKRAGFDVIGYDVSEASRTLAAQDGIAVASELADALKDREVILSSLPNPPITREAWLGDGGILEHASKGAIGIELSTIDPNTMREIAAAADQRGIRMIDAPVSGDPANALKGELVLITGGRQEDISAVDSILDCLAGSRHWTGDIGTGKAVKIVNNMMTMGNLVIASEAFALGTAAGVDPEKLFEILSQSGGRSHQFIKRFPSAIAGDFYDKAPFRMELGEKDVALGIELGRQIQQPTPAASTVREMISLGMATGNLGRDIVAMLDFYQKLGSRKTSK